MTGTAPDGSAVEIAMAGHWAVLLFLTTSCYDCRKWWEGMAGHHSSAVVIVTPSPSTESARQVEALAPEGARVVMSSDAWHDYGVVGAPWCVVVAGGVVVAHGPAPASWAELEAVSGRA